MRKNNEKIEDQVELNGKKKVKIYIRHLQKNLRHYVDAFVKAYLGPN